MTDTAAKAEPATAKEATAAKPATTPVVKPVEAPVAKAVAAPAPATPVAKATATPVASAPSVKETKPAVRRPVGRPRKNAAPQAQAKAVPSPKRTAAGRATTAAKKELKMADTIKTATEKTQAYFAEAGQRAKSAMEKGTRTFEDVNSFHKGNIEAIVESSKIAAKGFEKMGQDAAAYARTSYEKANEAFKAMAAVKSPTELFKLQSDFVRSSFDALVAETSRSTEAALKLAGEVSQPISNRFALAMEKVKTAA
ncbi:MAG: phasin family protein [Sphingomonas bacterium]